MIFQSFQKLHWNSFSNYNLVYEILYNHLGQEETFLFLRVVEKYLLFESASFLIESTCFFVLYNIFLFKIQTLDYILLKMLPKCIILMLTRFMKYWVAIIKLKYGLQIQYLINNHFNLIHSFIFQCIFWYVSYLHCNFHTFGNCRPNSIINNTSQ